MTKSHCMSNFVTLREDRLNILDCLEGQIDIRRDRDGRYAFTQMGREPVTLDSSDLKVLEALDVAPRPLIDTDTFAPADLLELMLPEGEVLIWTIFHYKGDKLSIVETAANSRAKTPDGRNVMFF